MTVTFHVPSIAPEPWMVAGRGSNFQTLGMQLRVAATTVGLDVGIFTNGVVLERRHVASMLDSLDAWHRAQHDPEDLSVVMVLGIYGEGPDATWGPGFAVQPDQPSAPDADLVDAALAYLHAQRYD